MCNIIRFKNRQINLYRPVEVYRNLNKGGYSIRQQGKVIAHAQAVMLRNAEFVVSQSGYKRMLKENRRNVHAWVNGFMVDSGMGTNATEAKGLSRVSYDRNRGNFMATVCNPSKPIKGAMIVALNNRGAFYAYGYYE